MNIASEFLSETREPQSGIPSLGLQPPSMEFIDNDTRKYHPQFHPSVNYDHAAPKTPTRHSESVHPWNNIFPAAMKRLKEQPLLRLKPELRIRDKTSWEDVYVQLQRAQWVNKSNGEDRIMRPPKGDQWLFDHRAPGPIAAIINLLDVFPKPSSIRTRIEETLQPEELERDFTHIELIMKTFPEDKYVYDAYLQLAVSILLAIEYTIEMLTSNRAVKSAIFGRSERYKSIVKNMDQIKKASDTLIKTSETSSGLIRSQQAMMNLVEDPMKIATSQARTMNVADLTSTVSEQIASLLRTMENVSVEVTAGRLLQEDSARLEQFLQSPPRPFSGPWQDNALDSPTQIQTASSQWYPALNMQQYLPNYYPPYPAPNMPQYLPRYYPTYPPEPPLGWHSLSHTREYLLQRAPRPSRLSRPFLGYYPLYTYQTQPAMPLNSSWLQDVLYIPCSDEEDLKRVVSGNHAIPPAHIGRADQVESTQPFQNWVIQPQSKALLVEGNFGSDDCHYISALSHLCFRWTGGFRILGYTSLVFFCGFHGKKEQGDEDENDQDVGGVTMMRSFILQLLKQHPDLDLTGLEKGTRLDSLEEGDLDQLCSLFVWLIKRFSDDIILVCIIDGVVHYEIDDFRDELLKVMECLLSLSKDDGIPFPVKILVTSPTSTKIIRELFTEEVDGDGDSQFISLDSFPEANHIPENEPQRYPVTAQDIHKTYPPYPVPYRYSGM